MSDRETRRKLEGLPPKKRGIVMAAVPCVCSSDLCEHKARVRCGQPVKVKLKCSVVIDKGGRPEEGPEFETGICEECWGTLTSHFPELTRNS